MNKTAAKFYERGPGIDKILSLLLALYMTVGYYCQASVAELVNILCLLQASCADAIDSVQQTIVHNAFQIFLRAVFGHFDDYGLVIVVRKTYIEKGIYNVFQFIRVPYIYGKEVTEVIGKAETCLEIA